MMAALPLLEIEELSCGYQRDRPVLSSVTLAVAGGETVALVGPSGCGKTTLLKTLLELVPPLGGRATILGSARDPRRGGVGYIPQRLGLVEHASALRNVLAGALPETGRLRSLLGTFRSEHIELAHQALERVGLGHKVDELPRHLSGGERRRVAIARTLAQRPALLLGDEVLSELDDGTATIVLDTLQQLQQETGMGVLMVEHNIERSCEIADLVCCLGHGALRATLEPSPDRLRRARAVLAAHALP